MTGWSHELTLVHEGAICENLVSVGEAVGTNITDKLLQHGRLLAEEGRWGIIVSVLQWPGDGNISRCRDATHLLLGLKVYGRSELDGSFLYRLSLSGSSSCVRCEGDFTLAESSHDGFPRSIRCELGSFDVLLRSLELRLIVFVRLISKRVSNDILVVCETGIGSDL